MSLPGIVIQIGADTKDAIDGINKVNTALGEQLTGPEKFKAAVDKAFVPALAVLGGLGAAAITFGKAAAEDAAQADILAQALRNTTGATDDQVASVEDWIAAQGKVLGVADDQLRPALGALARATGDIAEAQQAAALAMDISAATGKDLGSVSDALAKAYAGNTTSLGRLVPGLDKAILKSGDLGAIQGELSRLVGGSAATAANSAAGQWGRFQLALSETGEAIGAALLPLMDQILPKLQAFGSWAQENSGLLLTIGIAIGVVAGAIVVLKIAMEAWTVVQWALNSALLANPITWIVVAIIAFVAAIVLAYNKVEWFRDFIDAAWAKIQQVVQVVVDWFVTNVWPTLQKVWDGIKVAIAAVVDWFQAYAWPVIQQVIDWIRAYFVAYFKVVAKGWEVLQAGIKIVVDWFMEYVWPWIQKAIDLIKAYFTTYFTVVGKGWELLQTAIKAVVDWITGTLVPAIQAQVQLISDAFTTAIDFVKGLWDGLLEFLGGLITKFKDIGGRVVQGIKDGFAVPWNAFMGWVQEQINKLPDVAKKVLGIASPSKVFKALGQDVVDGWAQGLRGMATVNDLVAAGATDLVDGLQRNTLQLASPSAGGTGASGRTTAGGSVLVTEEQIARAIYAILARSDGRNGLRQAVA